jgi:hypothetical protein
METRLEIEDSDVDVLKPLYLRIHILSYLSRARVRLSSKA